MGCWKKFRGRVCFLREKACFFQGVVHHTVAPELCTGVHPWHPHVRMQCGSLTMVYPGRPESFRDILWPEAVLRPWTSPAPHPGVRALGTFPASTAEAGRLTSPAVQINVISLVFVFWTTHINCLARLLLAITCLLFPHEVTHAPRQPFGLRDRFIGETWCTAIFWSYLRLTLAADRASLFRKCLWQDCDLCHSAMLFPLLVLGLSLLHAFSCAAG